MKKLFDFVVCCLWVLSIGGIGYLFYDKHILFAIASIATFAMAFPFVKKMFKDLINQ